MDNQVPTIEEEESFLRWFIESTGTLLLALDGVEVIGMLSIERLTHYQENHRAHIAVSVKKECRSKGIGTQLLNMAKTWAKENSVQSIELEAIAINPAISLYKKLGYKEIGLIINGVKISEEYHDIVLMQYTL